MKKVVIKPHITEKTIEKTQNSVFTFVVGKLARKEEIKKYVEKTFGVNVLTINTAKNAPEIKKNQRFGKFYTKPGLKKAYVKLKKGQKIDLFDLEESKK